jgi:uncharacterized protein (DUF1015 family)
MHGLRNGELFMAEVLPLRGIRYAPRVVGDIAQVVTPPYDVISKEAQAAYYDRSPYNVIRLEFGKLLPEDNEFSNVYSRAAATYADWRLQGVLQQDATPAYYAYQQRFTYGNHSGTRNSLLARVRLEPWEAHVVLRHEHTRTKDKADRLNLLRACATNFSPIMSMYDDPQGRMRRILNTYAEGAEVQFVDEAGVEHRLHPLTDVQQISLIQDCFAPRQLYIADGHHRYETALAYRQEVLDARHELSPHDAANFVLMALIDLDDPGLLVLPTHRLFYGLPQEALTRLTEQSGQYFTVQPVAVTTSGALEQQLAQAGEQQPAFVLCTAQQTMLLTLNASGQAAMQTSEHSAAWNALDVAIAHKLLIEQLLGLSEADMAAGTHIRYSHDATEVLQAVRTGGAQVGLLLNATRVRQVCDVAQADDQMPQKSTYFYPKLITGLVMNPLW